MKDFVVYTANGKVIRNGVCQDETFIFQAENDEFVLEAQFFGNQYVENGVLVNMPENPSDDHRFDYTTKTWVIDTQGVAARALAKRNQLLAVGPDRVNPMWWASMSTADQMAVTEYRQALLDVPQQPGYPLKIDWPPPPEVFSQ